VTRLAELNRFFVRALGRDQAARPANASAFFAEFDRALSGKARPANEPVFSGIVSEEFVLPERDGWDTIEERRPLGQSVTSEMFGDTLGGEQPAVDRKRSARHLHSGWMTSPPTQTGTTASEPGGLYAPGPAKGAGQLKRHQSVTEVIVRARPTSAAAPLSRVLLLVVTALVLIAGLAGYWVGGG
jgi:hypothetical protein